MIEGRFRINDVESALFLLLGGAGALIQRILMAQSDAEARMIAQEVLLLMLTALGLQQDDAQRVTTQIIEDTLRNTSVSEHARRNTVAQTRNTIAPHFQI